MWKNPHVHQYGDRRIVGVPEIVEQPQVQVQLEHLHGLWCWVTCPKHWWRHEGDQYHPLHQQGRNPHHLLEGHHVHKICVYVRTEKKEPNQLRATLRGNLIIYPKDVRTPIANLLWINIFLNMEISTLGARFATANISYFYLMTPLMWPESAWIKLGRRWLMNTTCMSCLTWRMGLHLHRPPDVQTSAKRVSRPWLAGRMPKCQRALPIQSHTRLVEAQKQIYSVCFGSGWFWDWIHAWP